MSLALARIDDRLVHGQVIQGCCGPLRARRLLLCSDDVVHDDMQRRLYAAAVPSDLTLEILEREACLPRLAQLAAAGSDDQTILVVESPADMRWLVDSGAAIETVNLGGLHARAGAEEVWPGYFLTNEDRDHLRAMIASGVAIRVQTVVGAPGRDGAPALGAP